MQTSRRRFLSLSAFGLVAVAAGGIGVGLQSTKICVPATPLRSLSPRGFSVLSAVADRVMPGGDGFPVARDLQIAEQIDALLADAPAGFVKDIERALEFLENALVGLVLDGRPVPFSQADGVKQDEILETWLGSRITIRQTVAKSLISLCTATYWACPDVWRGVGYPGPPAVAGEWATPYSMPEDGGAQ